ncbi:hypothetical protein BDV23DRAFT_95408 [Aspergillus alliaceus]|uniref:Uncharacterized protein n=1 Tax=Petromyces alliaceus TaxID=209559 RepID=A0A5N7CMU5_PETAA|nr:hypothetical protein BDV23DRAFT_95408 [Aspergillus alliaceus]
MYDDTDYDHVRFGAIWHKDTLYSGLTLLSFKKSLAFFLPIRRSANAENEYVPGPTPRSLDMAKKKICGQNRYRHGLYHSRRAGPDMSEPATTWVETFDRTWVGLSLSDIDLTLVYHDADVVKGDMSVDQSKAQAEPVR